MIAPAAQRVVFSYTVAVGDADTDGIAIGANKLTLNEGTIKDAQVTQPHLPTTRWTPTPDISCRPPEAYSFLQSTFEGIKDGRVRITIKPPDTTVMAVSGSIAERSANLSPHIKIHDNN